MTGQLPTIEKALKEDGLFRKVWINFFRGLGDALSADGTIETGDIIVNSLTPNRLNSSDADKKIVSVLNFALWALGTTSEIEVSDNGDGTITIGLPDDVAITNNLDASNTITIGNNLNVGNNADIINDLDVGNNLDVGNELNVSANCSIGDSLNVVNDISAGADITAGNDLTVGVDAEIGNDLQVDNDALIERDHTVNRNVYLKSNIKLYFDNV